MCFFGFYYHYWARLPSMCMRACACVYLFLCFFLFPTYYFGLFCLFVVSLRSFMLPLSLFLSLFYVCLFVCMCNHFLLLFEQTDIEKIRTLDGFSFSNNIIDDHTQKKVTIHILKKTEKRDPKKVFFLSFWKELQR